LTDNKKLYRFWCFPESNSFLMEKLDNEKEPSVIIRNILTDYFKGKLVKATTPDLEQRKLVAQVKKLEAEVKIKEWTVAHLGTFGTMPSHAAESAMREALVSFIDEKNQVFWCPWSGCEEGFRWKFRTDLADKKLLFIDHYYQKHGAYLPADKEKELQAL